VEDGPKNYDIPNCARSTYFSTYHGIFNLFCMFYNLSGCMLILNLAVVPGQPQVGTITDYIPFCTSSSEYKATIAPDYIGLKVE
jgi:hypothetical protein